MPASPELAALAQATLGAALDGLARDAEAPAAPACAK
jgi:hypothetical protein